MIEATSVYGAGLYFEHSHKEHYLTSNIEYYAKEEDCTYKWVPSSNGEVVANAIQFRSPPFTFYPGRTNAFNSVQVGKVTLEHRVMYYAYGGKGYSVRTYEVLVCVKEDTEKIKQENLRLRAELADKTQEISTFNAQLIGKMNELSTLQAELDEKIQKVSSLEDLLKVCSNKLFK